MTTTPDALFTDDEPRAVARASDPGTSWAAASSVHSITARQAALLDLLRRTGPASDDQLAAQYAWRASGGIVPAQSPSGLRTRRAELVVRGLVEDTGRRARNPHGRSVIVWRAVA